MAKTQVGLMTFGLKLHMSSFALHYFCDISQSPHNLFLQCASLHHPNMAIACLFEHIDTDKFYTKDKHKHYTVCTTVCTFSVMNQKQHL